MLLQQIEDSVSLPAAPLAIKLGMMVAVLFKMSDKGL